MVLLKYFHEQQLFFYGGLLLLVLGTYGAALYGDEEHFFTATVYLHRRLTIIESSI